MSTKKTLAQIAQMAINVQDACNLAGVLRAYVEVVDVLRLEADRVPGHDGDWIRLHPISILFGSKIASMINNTTDGEQFAKAYRECEVLAEPSSDFRHEVRT